MWYYSKNFFIILKFSTAPKSMIYCYQGAYIAAVYLVGPQKPTLDVKSQSHLEHLVFGHYKTK